MSAAGAHNKLLCQFTADATGKRVVAGPTEATAIGNIMVQALACGQVGSLSDIRQIVAGASELNEYEPRDSDAWSDAYVRFKVMSSRLET